MSSTTIVFWIEFSTDWTPARYLPARRTAPMLCPLPARKTGGVVDWLPEMVRASTRPGEFAIELQLAIVTSVELLAPSGVSVIVPAGHGSAGSALSVIGVSGPLGPPA
jgi:hypothetical protein